MLRCLIATTLVACGTVGQATGRAGEFNQVLSVGDAAPAWKDLPGTDGKTHSLADLKGKPLVVVVFTCNSCPIARDYEERIGEFTKRHADKVAVVAINVNLVPEDSPEQMKKRAEAQKFPFAYLFDESQQIARDYGATGTPEFFLLSPEKAGERKVLYMGAMDDDTDPDKAKTNYLEAAVEAALSGKTPAKAETFANGCRIRFARTRRP
jgi:peroxiredoxin